MAPPRKSKAGGEEKGKSVVPPSTRTLRSMDRKTRSGHSASSSKLVSLEDPEKKARKSTAKQGGGATKKIKKEKETAVKVEKEEEPTEDDAAGQVEKDEEPTEDEAAADDDSGRRKIVIEHCKQCTSFKTRAHQVKKGLEEAVPGILVTLNADKPRRGCFEIREEGGEVFVSLLDMKRPFKPMKDLDMATVIADIVKKIK